MVFEHTRINKKANAFTDTIVVVVALTAFAIISIFGYKIFGELNTDIQADTGMNNESKTAMTTIDTTYVGTFDGAFITILVLLWVVTIIASFKIDTHPIFFIFVFILLAVTIYIGGEMSNAYQEIMQDSEMSATADQFTMTNLLINNYIMVVMIIGFSIVISLFAKIWYFT